MRPEPRPCPECDADLKADSTCPRCLTSWDSFTVMRKVAGLLSNTRQTDFLSSLRVEDLVKVALACLRSGWDVTPCDLTEREISLAMMGLDRDLKKSLERLAG